MKKSVRVILKATAILALLCAIIFLTKPFDALSSLSLYNRVYPGRSRLPFGENPRAAYNFSLTNLNAMFASHDISAAQEKTPDELRVVLIGDSSLWGTLLKPDETVAARLDGQTVTIDGQVKTVNAYNLGYPTMSLTKDLLILRRALAFDPDLIVWTMTMESFPVEKQLTVPIVAANLDEVAKIVRDYNIPSIQQALKDATQAQTPPDFNAARRASFDLIRLQLYGFLYAATGIDQDYPTDYPHPTLDLEADDRFHGVSGVYPKEDLAWDVLKAAGELVGNRALLFVNEPMIISDGKNANIRYNFYVPRVAYDAWHEDWYETCNNIGAGLDLWNLLPNDNFTNSAIHYDAVGAERIAAEILERIPAAIAAKNEQVHEN